MAAGDNKIFRDFVLKVNEGQYAEADTWSLAFVSDTFASVSADTVDPQLSTVTVTSGGNVSASYNLANFAITRSTNTVTFDADDITSITKSGTNPSDVRCAVVYNNTSTNDDLVCIFDLTSDGSTALDLANNDLAFTFGASGIITATVA